jgi:hypothetical protein
MDKQIIKKHKGTILAVLLLLIFVKPIFKVGLVVFAIFYGSLDVMLNDGRVIENSKYHGQRIKLAPIASLVKQIDKSNSGSETGFYLIYFMGEQPSDAPSIAGYADKQIINLDDYLDLEVKEVRYSVKFFVGSSEKCIYESSKKPNIKIVESCKSAEQINNVTSLFIEVEEEIEKHGKAYLKVTPHDFKYLWRLNIRPLKQNTDHHIYEIKNISTYVSILRLLHKKDYYFNLSNIKVVKDI